MAKTTEEWIRELESDLQNEHEQEQEQEAYVLQVRRPGKPGMFRWGAWDKLTAVVLTVIAMVGIYLAAYYVGEMIVEAIRR
jgi:hypothetical protein